MVKSPCPLPLASLESILKSSKISGFLQLRDSKDPQVSGSEIKLHTGTKWKAHQAVRNMEIDFSIQKVVGKVPLGRSGLGLHHLSPEPERGTKEHRKFYTDMSKRQDSKEMYTKAVQMSVQGQWTNWSNYVQMDLSWKVIWALPPNLLPFIVNATYDTLPTPSNLKRWKIQDSNACPLCLKVEKENLLEQVGTTSHILSGCKFSLESGRYTFRHNEVLSKLKEILVNFLESIKSNPTRRSRKPWWSIKFVPPGHRQPKTKRRQRLGLLHDSKQWQLMVDIPSKSLIFPGHIAISDLRPDLIIFSNINKLIILIELTCPCEENFEDRHREKLTKYKDLKELIEFNGWCCYLFAIEVGARGYCSDSVPRCLRALGLGPKAVREACKDLGLVSSKSSFCIWMARDTKEWSPPDSQVEVTKSVVVDSNSSINISSQYNPFPVKSFTNTQVTNPATSNYRMEEARLPTSSGHIGNSPNTLARKPIQIGLPAGLQNLGATCYINSILQALFSIPEFSLNCFAGSSKYPIFVNHFRSMMTLMKSSKYPIDPNKFIARLGSFLSKEFEKPFITNKEQDVPEVLEPILEHLTGSSVFLRKKITIGSFTRKTCNTCFSEFDDTKEDWLLPVGLEPTVQEAVNLFHRRTDSEVDCRICKAKTNSTRESWFSELPEILIVHLKRYRREENTTRKDFRQVKHGDNITIDVIQDSEILVPNQVTFKLRAVINHSGPFGKGHYWTNVRYSGSEKWIICNDKAIIVDHNQKKVLDPLHPYVLIYTKV